MNLTPRERFAVVCSLVEAAARQRQRHGGTFLDKLQGETIMLKPIEMEELADRIEQEGEPNGDLVS